MLPRVVLLLALAIVVSGCADTGGLDTEEDADGAGADTSGTASGSVSASGSKSATGTGSARPASSGNGTGDADANSAPVIADFTVNATGLAATFHFNVTDADGDPLTYTLSFGDNATADGTVAGPMNATHGYTAAGTYNATLVVVDGNANATATVQVSVAPATPPTPPTKSISCTVQLGTTGVSLRGTINLGACSLGTVSVPVVLAAITLPTGCTGHYDTNPGDTSLTGGAKVGERYEKGTEFVMQCGPGAVNAKGTMDYYEAA